MNMRSSGTCLAASRMCCALGKVTLPAKEIMKPRSSAAWRARPGPGEAVQDAAQPLDAQCSRISRSQSSQAFSLFVGRPAVNHDRQLRRPCHLHLLQENLLLHVARRVIVEIVQPNFAPGDDLGACAPVAQVPRKSASVCQLGFVGMDRRRWRRYSSYCSASRMPQSSVPGSGRHCRWPQSFRCRPARRARNHLRRGRRQIACHRDERGSR